ncbi:MAG TPA: DUF1634 domain-containing protein [Candidatus Binataceae bacterium]|nr:DUF1634 domain-containing protein [Candidatus Binataceae bacterium]
MRSEEHRRELNEVENKILRRWTPMLLRTILLVAIALLSGGLILTAVAEPGYFVSRYNQAQAGHLFGRETVIGLWSNMLAGQPHAILTLGLYALTLVPLARVAFCLILFMKQRDFTYVMLTGYVLAGLIAGVLLGKVG